MCEEKITYADVEEYQGLFTLAPSFLLETFAKRNTNLVLMFKSIIKSYMDSLTEIQKEKLDIIHVHSFMGLYAEFLEAAKQSGRGVIPTVAPIHTWKEALASMADLDYNVILYENAEGMKPTAECLKTAGKKGSIGIFVGPEGGFTEDEVAQCQEHSAECLSLGKRILRTETAGLAMLSMLMLAIECAEQKE